MRLFTNNYAYGLALACSAAICSCTPNHHSQTLTTGGHINRDAVPVERLYLNSQFFSFAATAKLGGRALHFSVPGNPNMLLVDDAVAQQPNPTPAADGEHIDYNGHIVWLGPQSEWWANQNLNPKRRDAGARWPPDPWLVWSENKILTSTPTEITLQGPNSPLSGISVNKTFALIDDGSKLRVAAVARNNNGHGVGNNLWFNTRITTDAVIYVPALDHNAARFSAPQNPSQPEAFLPLNNVIKISRAIALGEELRKINRDTGNLTEAKKSSRHLSYRREKLFIPASEGWLAAFIKGQLLLIEFEPIASSRISPEHALIEIYYAFGKGDSPAMIELEVHGPLTHYGAGESIEFYETWQALPYTGVDTDEARLNFLQGALNASSSTR